MQMCIRDRVGVGAATAVTLGRPKGIVGIAVGDAACAVGQGTGAALGVLKIILRAASTLLADQLGACQRIRCQECPRCIGLSNNVAIGRGFVPQRVGGDACQGCADPPPIGVIAIG